MPERDTKTQPVTEAEKVKRAYGILAEIRAATYQRLAEFVLRNERRIRAETLGEESYSLCLQQMEDQFLNRLNIVERAVAELGRQDARENQPLATTYEVIEISAKREELPQRVADSLAEHGASDLLDICVLRADGHGAEIMLVMAREDPAPQVAAKQGKAKAEPQSGAQPGATGNDET